MEKIVWHKGPPPSRGWWPASRCKKPGVYRWWDGEFWSYDALEGNSGKAAAYSASIKTFRQEEIILTCWQKSIRQWGDRNDRASNKQNNFTHG